MQGIIVHMASSTAGFFDGQQDHLDLVRLGTAMYGVEANTSVARWLTRITGIKQVCHAHCPMKPCSCAGHSQIPMLKPP